MGQPPFQLNFTSNFIEREYQLVTGSDDQGTELNQYKSLVKSDQ